MESNTTGIKAWDDLYELKTLTLPDTATDEDKLKLVASLGAEWKPIPLTEGIRSPWYVVPGGLTKADFAKRRA